MPPKAKIAAPVDRPLSRAYLREFSGWSTEYPPGVSEPSSQRIMENLMVNREGSIRVRPGLRYLTYASQAPFSTTLEVVGSHEVFLLLDGTKGYLFAVREASGLVGFRVAVANVGDEQYPFRVVGIGDPLVMISPPPEPFSAGTTYVRYLQIDNKIVALGNNGDAIRIFYVGEGTRRGVVPRALTQPFWTYTHKPIVRHPKPQSIQDPSSYPPAYNNSEQGGTALGLTNEEREGDPPYSIGYYYTFYNEVGESLPSQVTVVKVRRPWSKWRWEGVNQTKVIQVPDDPETPGYEPGDTHPETVPNYSSFPNGVEENNPALVADQLIIFPPASVYNNAISEGAQGFHVYAIMWSNQDPVPVEGFLVGTFDMSAGLTHSDHAWVRHSPAPSDNSRSSAVPTFTNRFNYSDPSHAAQGLVVSDRLVLVYDQTRQAVIKWTSNQFGEYLNTTGNRGGGYKTLTSGNLSVPACVKLWQNPQSADTITILCLGINGESTAYYMSPIQVASQSDATNGFGFEETTATPGTVSPYGCEVVNNALYHPLEDSLMKSTASNYNISHKTMTDLIKTEWSQLLNKHRIVASELDNRLYYLVHNPKGAALEAGCRGNEVWVMDVGKKEGGSWSRWLVQGGSLRKIEVNGFLCMSITRPEGLYAFDPRRSYDDYVIGPNVLQRPIPWQMETNTQGANRAHDAWAHLQQANIVVGNFQGKMRYGVKGWDVHGRMIDMSKVLAYDVPLPDDGAPSDLEDHLLIRRDLKEWRFYASSVEDQGVVQHSTGQISLVQYRYAPVTVNVGYEYGSVETFEYGNSGSGQSMTNSGVPIPAIDQARP